MKVAEVPTLQVNEQKPAIISKVCQTWMIILSYDTKLAKDLNETSNHIDPFFPGL
jgi:hypothetical protein